MLSKYPEKPLRFYNCGTPGDATDYALQDDYSEIYHRILTQYPDSCEMIRYEAKHGHWTVINRKGDHIEGALFPTIIPSENEAEFQIIGGGWLHTFNNSIKRQTCKNHIRKEC